MHLGGARAATEQAPKQRQRCARVWDPVRSLLRRGNPMLRRTTVIQMSLTPTEETDKDRTGCDVAIEGERRWAR